MNKKIGKIILQAKLWIIAASVLPLSALSGLFFLHFVGFETYWEIFLTTGGILMFFISSLWWWWAIYKILDLHKSMNNTIDNFSEIKQIVIEIKEEIK